MRLMISSSPSLSSSSSSQLTCLLRSIFSSSPPIPLCCNYSSSSSSSSPPEEEVLEEAQTSLLNSSSSSSPVAAAAAAAAAETQTPPCSILFNPNNNPRTRTPLEKQFETWVDKLKPGFTPLDVDDALRSQSDPDLALDIFRWTAQRRGYKHNHITYHTMIQISISGKRFGHTETLIDEVVAGACSGSLPLYNSIIRYCCIRRPLFNRAFDVYKKMLKSPPPHSRPSLETYTMLLNALLRKFNKLNICYVYLHAVRSLLKQMKASGVIPDTYALNLIIKAYSKCLEMDGAIRVFREMGLYGCQPNSFSYSYIVKGLCEKGRVTQGFDFYKEMRDKALIPTSTTYMILICSLSLERRFEEAIEIMFDMLGNSSMVPDVLTYRTLLEGLCREGKGDEAFELLEELRKKQGSMGDKTYKNLLDELHFLSQE